MKIAARILSFFVLIALATFYMACGGGEGNEESEMDQQIKKLNGTWANPTVTMDGQAHALNHSGMVLNIQGTAGNSSVSYTVSGRPQGPSAWPSGGTLTFGTNVKQNLIREDQVPVTYTVTDTKLTLDFTFTGTPYTSSGRVSSVSGNWHFEFTKQP
jgi:phage tail sheath gpL-like